MKFLNAQLFLLPLLALLMSGCAGFRSGWESVAYTGEYPGEKQQRETTRHPYADPTLRFPGLELEVGIDNRLRTRDYQVYLFVLPLWIDPRDVYIQNNQPGKTRVRITVTPGDGSFVFHPSRTVLRVSGKEHKAVDVFEYAMRNGEGLKVEEGGKWSLLPVADGLTLSSAGGKYHFSIDFAIPTPSPQSPEILVDLSRALVSPRHPPLPPIRFQPVRWKEGYT